MSLTPLMVYIGINEGVSRYNFAFLSYLPIVLMLTLLPISLAVYTGVYFYLTRKEYKLVDPIGLDEIEIEVDESA